MPSFRPQLLRLAGFSLVGGLVAFAGCSSSASTAISVTHPTMIRVEPEDFLGGVPCDPNGSGLKRYVATIVDYDFGEGGAGGEPATPSGGAGGEVAALPDARGFRAPSSLPTPCTTGVGFGFVVPGRHYEVLIDGYDRSDIVPRAIGSSEMLPADAVGPDVPSDIAVRTSVLYPRWKTRCRRAIAVDSTIVQAGDCDPFPSGAGTTGTVRVALSPLLGQLHCGSAPGEVEHFTVTATLPDGTTQAQDVACPVAVDAPAPAAVFPNIEARSKLSFYVEAFGADSNISAIAGAECNVLAEADASRDATCAALSSVSTVKLDVAAALKQLGASCSADVVSSVTVTAMPVADNTPKSLPPPDCLQPYTLGFAAGMTTGGLILTTTLNTGEQLSLNCHALLEPGRVVAATCEP